MGYFGLCQRGLNLMKRLLICFVSAFLPVLLLAQGFEDQLAKYRYGGASGKRISVNVRNKPLKELLQFIGGKAGVNILVDPEIKDRVSIRLIDVYWKNALKVITEQAGCVVEEISPNLYRVTKPPQVSMEFFGSDLREVLDFLAKQSGSNIIISAQVGGKVTLSLRNVHWRQALDTIVKTAGFVAVEEEGNIIRIVTKQSLRDQLETEVLLLKYVRPPAPYRAAISSKGSSTQGGVFFVGEARAPGDPVSSFTLYKALQKAVDPSIGEQVEYDPLTNAFVVRATKLTINRLRGIIKKLDKEPLQIFLDVKFIKTNSNSLLERGLRFAPSGDGTDGLVIRNVFDITNAPSLDASQDPNVNPSWWEPLPPNFRGLFPYEFGDKNTITKRFRVPAVLDFRQMLMVLRLAKNSDNTRIIQSPSIMTLNHQEATIFVGKSVPFAEQRATQDPNGNVSVTLRQGQGSPVSVGFHLFVIPHIIPDTSKIMLTIIPKFNFLSGPDNGFQTFDVAGNRISLPETQEQILVTNLMIEDGKTAVIGGILSERKQEIISKVPLLSSIPLLGNLFTYKSINTIQENLIILITPRIIRSTEHLAVISRRQLIDFAKLEYFTAVQEGRAEDGQFKEAPVVENSYEGILQKAYREEELTLKRAKAAYEKVLQEVQKALSRNDFTGARDAIERYPETFRLTTKYGELLEAKRREINRLEKEYILKKLREKALEEEEE